MPDIETKAALVKEPAQDEGDPGVVRVNVNLPEEIASTLKSTAREAGLTMTEVLRQAIMHESFLRKELKARKRLLLRDVDGSLTEIIIS